LSTFSAPQIPPGAPTLARHVQALLGLILSPDPAATDIDSSGVINGAVSALAALPRFDANMRNIDGITHYKDREGGWRPESSIKPEHLLQDELARKVYGGAVSVNASMSRFKSHTLSEIQAYLDLLAEKYGAKKVALEDGVAPIRSLDGRYEISVTPARKAVATPEVSAAKSLLDDWLSETSAGEPLAGIIRDAFGLGEGGALRVSELLRLQRRNVDHPKWIEAMDLLRRGMEVVCDGIAIRCYEIRDGEKVMIPLRMSRV
jgi:hypothetical protein